jgi:hypothetical protein
MKKQIITALLLSLASTVYAQTNDELIASVKENSKIDLASHHLLCGELTTLIEVKGSVVKVSNSSGDKSFDEKILKDVKASVSNDFSGWVEFPVTSESSITCDEYNLTNSVLPIGLESQ